MLLVFHSIYAILLPIYNIFPAYLMRMDRKRGACRRKQRTDCDDEVDGVQPIMKILVPEKRVVDYNVKPRLSANLDLATAFLDDLGCIALKGSQ